MTDDEALRRAIQRWAGMVSPEALADIQARPELYAAVAKTLIEKHGVEAFAELARTMADASDDDLAALRDRLAAPPED